MADLLFWFSIAVPAYAYLGYPLALLALRLIIHRPVRKKPIEPFISLLIPAYSEERVIARKIRNSLALDYPAGKLEIVVACDGSPDRTPAIAKSLADGERVRVLDFPVNRGKLATLNAGVPSLRGEIVVFSDAAALLYPDALRNLTANFADPEVGAAGGKYTVIRTGEVATGKSEDLYWKYETFLKKLESELSSVLGAHGQIHAIRKDLYPFPPPAIINDDYVIPTSVLSRGYRAVYDPTAIAYEEAQEMTGFGRRVRIMAGNLQQLRYISSVIAPFRPLPLFFFLSHKAIRLAVPFCMIGALVANLLLAGLPVYRILLLFQGVFYLLAAAGAAGRLKPRLLMLPYYFTMINAAMLVAAYHALTRRRTLAWK